MVWGLFPVDPLPGEDNYYFFNKGTYKVGRKGCDVTVNKDKSVSRIHAEILMDEMSSLDHLLKKPSKILSKVRIKDCSKYGTFLNKNLGSMEKVHEFPNKETMLKDGDLVSFGTGNATYRFSYVSFIFFICSPNNSKTNQLITKVSSIGASITKEWSLDCSHMLVDDSFPLSEDLIDAIVARKPLVQYSWVELIAGKNICTDIPSCNSHAPNLMLEGVSVKVVDPQSRKCCLKGYTFLLEPENEYKFEGRLQSLLEVGGANVSSAEMALEKNGNDRVVYVVPAGSSNHSSLPWVSEIDLVSAVISGYLDPSLITSPPDIDHYKRMIRVGPNTFGSGVRVDLKDLPNLKDLPEFDAADYYSMPVDMFGKAYLRAFRHDVEIAGNRVVQYAGRQERLGLGYIPPKKTEDGIKQPGPSHNEDQDIITNAERNHLNSLLESLSSSNVSEQKKAAKEVRVLIKKMPSLRAVFGECSDAVTKLLNPLSGNVNTHPDLQEDLITTVLNISIHDSNKKLVAQNPIVIPLLIESLKFGTPKTRCNSAAVLITLSALDSNKDIIVKAGALKPLVDLLDEGQPLAMKDAASAIFNLSVVHKNKGKAVSEGTIKVIMKKITDRILIDELLAILALLSSHHKAIEEMGELGAVSCLLSIIKEDTSDCNKENCIAILYTLCYYDRTKLKEIWIDEITNGTISNLARSGTSRAKRKANDILKRLDRYVSLVHTT